MSLKKFFLALCFVSTTASANQELIKQLDEAKSIAKALNNPSSSASQIDAFDDTNTNNAPQVPNHTTTNTHKTVKTKTTSSGHNIPIPTLEHTPVIHKDNAHLHSDQPTEHNLIPPTTPVHQHFVNQANYNQIAKTFYGSVKTKASLVPSKARTLGESLLGNDIQWRQQNCQYIAIKTGTNGALAVSLNAHNPVFVNTNIVVSHLPGNNGIAISKTQLQKLAKNISSSTAKNRYPRVNPWSYSSYSSPS